MAAFESLAQRGGVDLGSLAPLQRTLLVTDGTVTDILEAHALERIELVKLSQRAARDAESCRAFDAAPGEEFLERKILLRGAESGRVYVYAESVIAAGRLPAKLREGLASDTPLGRLWLEHKLETFKELFEMRRVPAGPLGQYFGGETPLLMRSYRVISGGRRTMAISEYFPETGRLHVACAVSGSRYYP